MTWQNISSVPKDGTFVLLYGTPYSKGDMAFGVGRFDTFREEWWERVSDTHKKLVSEEKCDWDLATMMGNIVPTHWMPLPSPPEPSP